MPRHARNLPNVFWSLNATSRNASSMSRFAGSCKRRWHKAMKRSKRPKPKKKSDRRKSKKDWRRRKQQRLRS